MYDIANTANNLISFMHIISTYHRFKSKVQGVYFQFCVINYYYEVAHISSNY